MVYCGKPSKGCSNCRERKIRCDQREPGCGQCEKRQQECPGYRNLVDLMFRDESSHVIKKARAKARKKAVVAADAADAAAAAVDTATVDAVDVDAVAVDTVAVDTVAVDAVAVDAIDAASSSPTRDVVSRKRPLTPRASPPRRVGGKTRSKALRLLTHSRSPPERRHNSSPQSDATTESGPWPSTPNWPSTPMITWLHNLAPTCQERGTAYFFTRYVSIDENVCHQRFDFVYEIWRPTTLAPEHQADGVLASMTAVGLLGIAHMAHSRDLMQAARRSYGTALRLTNCALGNPREAVKDSTMLSILILGLFEMMTEANPRTMKAWQEHVNGAAELARLRGLSQFRSRVGIRMFMMLCQNVMISCIQKERPMPRALVDLRNELGRLLPAGEIGWRISNPIYKVLQARYDIKRGDITDPEVILETLLGIESEFDELIAIFPDAWQYRVFRVARPHLPAVFGSTVHVYPSLWHATVWNGLRTVRMLILETILGEIHKRFQSTPARLISDRWDEEFRRARNKMERICEAIAASIPQHLGLLNQDGDYVDSLTPVSTPLPSVEVGESPNEPSGPPTVVHLPCRRNPVSSSPVREPSPGHNGPTIADPTRARNPEEEAERFMLLASATNTVVWPLYLVGMSSVCTMPMKAYVIERLRAIHVETGLRQAGTVAELVEEHQASTQWLYEPLRSESDCLSVVKTESPGRTKLLPV